MTDWFLEWFLLLSASSLVLVSICLSNTVCKLSVTPLTTEGCLLALNSDDNVSSRCLTVSSSEVDTRLESNVSSVWSRVELVSGDVLLNSGLAKELEEIIDVGVDLDDGECLQISTVC